MKESKPYPRIEEENGSSLTAQEPSVAYAYADNCQVESPAEIPGLPRSWDELVECVTEGEEELERGDFLPWETATQRIKAHLAGYGS